MLDSSVAHTDFTFSNAAMWYRSLDRLIHHVNLVSAPPAALLHDVISAPATLCLTQSAADWPTACLQDGRVNAFYSTPARYVEAKRTQHPGVQVGSAAVHLHLIPSALSCLSIAVLDHSTLQGTPGAVPSVSVSCGAAPASAHSRRCIRLWLLWCPAVGPQD